MACTTFSWNDRQPAMSSLNQQRTQKYIAARQQNAAWLLLSSRRAPLMLSCLEALFELHRVGRGLLQKLRRRGRPHHPSPAQFGLHALFVTPNKELRLLRNHTRSAVLVHRRGRQASLACLSWEELGEKRSAALEERSKPAEIVSLIGC